MAYTWYDVMVPWEGKVPYTILHATNLRNLGHCCLTVLHVYRSLMTRKMNTANLSVVQFWQSAWQWATNELKFNYFASMSTADCGPSQGLCESWLYQRSAGCLRRFSVIVRSPASYSKWEAWFTIRARLGIVSWAYMQCSSEFLPNMMVCFEIEVGMADTTSHSHEGGQWH